MLEWRTRFWLRSYLRSSMWLVPLGAYLGVPTPGNATVWTAATVARIRQRLEFGAGISVKRAPGAPLTRARTHKVQIAGQRLADVRFGAHFGLKYRLGQVRG